MREVQKEIELLTAAIEAHFTRLLIDTPAMQTLSDQELANYKAVYGLGFVAGIDYGYERLNVLSGR